MNQDMTLDYSNQNLLNKAFKPTNYQGVNDLNELNFEPK